MRTIYLLKGYFIDESCDKYDFIVGAFENKTQVTTIIDNLKSSVSVVDDILKISPKAIDNIVLALASEDFCKTPPKFYFFYEEIPYFKDLEKRILLD